ncbi:hypothetical protein [Streptacidiphilus sp. PAMC 29251]
MASPDGDLEGRCLAHLVREFPWQEFGYKAGRWERADSPLGLFNHRRWGRNREVLQLIDPRGGRPVGELRDAGGVRLPEPAGTVWIAGDPRTVAGYSPVGDGVRVLRLAVSPFVPRREALEFAATMRPGDRPPFPLVPYEERQPHGGPTWLADRPGKPTRGDGYTWNATGY